jgi:hypothetical protein
MFSADDPLTDDDEDTKSLPLRSCYGSIGELSNNGSKKQHDKKKLQQQQTETNAGLLTASNAASANPSMATLKSSDNIVGDLKRSTSMNVHRADRGSKSLNRTTTPNSSAVVRLSKASIEVDQLGWRLVNQFFFLFFQVFC